jgi:glucose/arabinose dehydrogenase
MSFRAIAAVVLALVVAGPSFAQTPATAPTPPSRPAGPPPLPPYVPPAPGQPVERQPSSARGQTQTPAFPEQNRAPYTPSHVQFNVETFADGLVQPWGLAFLPDERMLVTERPGRIRIVSKDGKLSDPIDGVPPVHIQQISGLQDVAIDPHFSSNHLVYWTFVEPRPGPANSSATSVARGRLVEGPKPRFEDVKIIYRQEPDLVTEHSNYGGRIVFDAKGYMFVTLGDRDSMSVRPMIQQMDTGVGKVVHITTDGAPAPNNPFLHKAGVLPELWALGFRNPIGATLKPGTQDLWVVDVGPRGGDEIDQVLPGRNYGWPVIGYGQEYTGDRVGEGTQKAGYEQPIYYWDPVISPSGIAFYTGDKFPDWKGNVFVTSLTQRHLDRLVMKGEKVVGEERLLYDLGERLRQVKQGPDGLLYILTDNDKGRILRITP